MSENESQPSQAAETPQAQLADADLESVAGGTTIIDQAIDGVVDSVKRWVDILT